MVPVVQNLGLIDRNSRYRGPWGCKVPSCYGFIPGGQQGRKQALRSHQCSSW